MDRGEGVAGGELIWAVSPDPALQSSFSDVSLVSVPVRSAAAFQHRWFHWEELMLSVKEAPSALREQAGWLPTRHQPLLLISPPGILTFYFQPAG